MQTIATPAGGLYDAGDRVIVRLVRREQVESTDGFCQELVVGSIQLDSIASATGTPRLGEARPRVAVITYTSE